MIYDTPSEGFILCLLGSDKPIIESLQPNDVDQTEALENQFQGMSDISFSYEDYTSARTDLIKKVNDNLTQMDKEFILSFESGNPDWGKCCAGDLSNYPSIQWKMLNIQKLKKTNPKKFELGITKLKDFLGIEAMSCKGEQ